MIMNICILDGFTLNPGDLDWSPISTLGNCTIYDRTEKSSVISRAENAEIILTNKVIIDAETMAQLPKLKYIGVLATGYNVVDIKAAKDRGIIVTNVPAYSTMSVAQMVFAHILNIANSVAHYADGITKWAECKDFCYFDTKLTELAGKTMGIIGLGNTGLATAKIALAFGMKVIAVTSKKKEQLPCGIDPVSKDTLFKEADIISLNCPLTDSTREIINSKSIALMKKSANNVNTGRGPLINDQDVADALNSGRIAAYAADVLTVEPPQPTNPLLTAKNTFITPHIAWASKEARTRLLNIAADNVKNFINGNPSNIIQ